MSKLLPYLFIPWIFFPSCGPVTPGEQKEQTLEFNEFTSVAERFSIEKAGDFHILRVVDPWQNAEHACYRYLLGSGQSTVPDSLNDMPFIKTPVDRVILMSTTYITCIDSLQKTSSIVGLSGSKYVYSPDVRQMIHKGHIQDVGYDQGLNYEIIVDLKPDVLFMYGVEAGVTQTVRKLEDLGIQVVMCADYLEDEPLGRTEWIKFFSMFFDKYKVADSIFSRISKRYDSLVRQGNSIQDHRSVFVGLPWKDSWYIPGGTSFAARFIEDAGGNYVFSDLDGSEAKAYDLEFVYSRIMEADIWLNAGVAKDMKTILDHDERFAGIRSFVSGEVYNNNRRINQAGGNDYWESGIMNPDLILNDLLHIFNGDSDSLFYYKRLH